MAWFRKDKKPLEARKKRDVPADIFEQCPGCGEVLYRERLARNFSVCESCGYHLRISAEGYLSILLDPGSFEELDGDLRANDPLAFVDVKPYVNRIATAESAGKSEAVVTASGRLDGIEIAIAAMDFSFIGGSMGSVVGEKIARAGRSALQRSVPFIIVSQSGGARMQEGIYSLMQMAKTSTVLARLHEASLPFISVLTNPTTGGTTASHSMLGDVNLAEPNALIGFTGPRVIEETIKQELPKGFQRSEFQLEHGMIDLVVDRRDLKETIALILRHQRAGWTE
tara:strand:- start:1469 stop:2317 length:849 start_codon:yes stop_codon:yes gene_type:complete